MQRPFHGASSHLSYQEIIKVEAMTAALRFQAVQQYVAVEKHRALAEALKGLRATLAARGVEIGQSSCSTHLTNTIDKNYV
jgi:hypothetical protein